MALVATFGTLAFVIPLRLSTAAGGALGSAGEADAGQAGGANGGAGGSDDGGPPVVSSYGCFALSGDGGELQVSGAAREKGRAGK